MGQVRDLPKFVVAGQPAAALSALSPPSGFFPAFMNWAHVHLLLNHFPTIGMIIGLGVFVTAIAAKSDDLKRASLVIFFAIALLSIPAFVTGTSAKLALEQRPRGLQGHD